MNAARINRDVTALRKKGIHLSPTSREFWELTGIGETGPRLSVFRAARQRAEKSGLTEYQAIVEAVATANDLLDFNRHGSRMLAARRLATFLNSGVQGNDKEVRTLFGYSNNYNHVADLISPYIKQSEGQVLSILEAKKVTVAAKAWAKLSFYAMVGVAMSLLYKDDEEYKKINQYFRNTHWVFKDSSGTWRRIPKPFSLGMASLVAERGFERMYHKDPAAIERMITGLFDIMLPPHTIPGLQIPYELWANKSAFTGAPIVPKHLEGLSGEMQFNKYTSEFSKWLAQGVGVSAAKLDYAIAGITGSLGRSLLDLSNPTLPAAGKALRDSGLPQMGLPTTPRPEMAQRDMIFVRRFTVDPARSSQSKREFWEAMSQTNGQMTGKAKSYKEFMDSQQYSEASELLRKAPENERAFALLQYHGTTSDKASHPMTRANAVLSVTNGIRRELDRGILKDDEGNAYSPSNRRVIQEMIEQIQMREARNAQIVIGERGYTHMKILDVEPVMAELAKKVPSLAAELEYRLSKPVPFLGKIKSFEDVREGWPDLKQKVLEPDFAGDNPTRRKVGRKS